MKIVQTKRYLKDLKRQGLRLRISTSWNWKLQAPQNLEMLFLALKASAKLDFPSATRENVAAKEQFIF